MTDSRWRSPLAHRAPLTAGDAARLTERPFIDLHVLRGDPARVAAGVEAATGVRLPVTARGSESDAMRSILWLSPDEWLLVGADAATAARLAEALAGVHHQLVDVSDYYTTIEVGGAALRALLAKLVAVDLHPRSFRRGEVLGTLLGSLNVWLWLTADERDAGGPCARLFVRRSHADHAWCLLAEAGREWGLPAQAPIGRVPLHERAANA
jgi:sarcosine oxidase subunit gamma